MTVCECMTVMRCVSSVCDFKYCVTLLYVGYVKCVSFGDTTCHMLQCVYVFMCLLRVSTYWWGWRCLCVCVATRCCCIILLYTDTNAETWNLELEIRWKGRTKGRGVRIQGDNPDANTHSKRIRKIYRIRALDTGHTRHSWFTATWICHVFVAPLEVKLLGVAVSANSSKSRIHGRAVVLDYIRFYKCT